MTTMLFKMFVVCLTLIVMMAATTEACQGKKPGKTAVAAGSGSCVAGYKYDCTVKVG